MSYLHCPTCQRAYNVAHRAACPSCGVRPGAPADPTEDLVAAADQLARAMARASSSELAAAEAILGRRAALPALPAPGAATTPAESPAVFTALADALRAMARANEPLDLSEQPTDDAVWGAPPPDARTRALLATLVTAVVTRVSPPKRLSAGRTRWKDRLLAPILEVRQRLRLLAQRA